MSDNCADVVNIKISKFGGLTKAKLAIELCSELGIAMTVEGKISVCNNIFNKTAMSLEIRPLAVLYLPPPL